MGILDFLTAVAVACVPLVATWISAGAVPWIRARTTAEQRKNLLALCRLAVEAAEQIFKGEGKGAERKEYAGTILRSQGVRLDEDTMNEYIEAAVLELRMRQGWGLTEVEREEDPPEEPHLDPGTGKGIWTEE